MTVIKSVVAPLLTAVLIILVGLEVGLRAFGFSYYWAFYRYPDWYRGFAPMPNVVARQDLEGHAVVRINHYGFRDREWPEKLVGAYRIAVLGDSMTEAVQLPLAETWWRLAEGRLNGCGYRGKPVEVMNFGVSGYSTAQELETLEHHVRAHHPDEVWLAFFPGNDLVENHPALNSDPIRPYLRHEGERWVMDYGFRDDARFRRKTSDLGHFYYDYLLRLRVVQGATLILQYRAGMAMLEQMDPRWTAEPGIDARVYAPPRDDRWESAWDATRELIRRIRDETRAMGATLRVIGLNTGAQVFPDTEPVAEMAERLGVPDLMYPNWLLGRFADDDGYAYVDLAAPMARRARAEQVYFHGFGGDHGTGHWNPRGHAAAAAALADRLCAAE